MLNKRKSIAVFVITVFQCSFAAILASNGKANLELFIQFFFEGLPKTLFVTAFVPAKSIDALKDAVHDKVKEWVDGIEKKDIPTNLKHARELLAEGIEEVLKAPLTEGEPFKDKIYIFIDELDRCRPDFAITLLETLKHFFSVKGIVFVLTVDLEQLEGSIKHVYGQHIDCEGYLMRFVNLFYNLPKPDNKAFTLHLIEETFGELPEKLYGIRDYTNNKKELDNNSFIAVFSSLAEAFNASLRDQIRIFQQLKIMSCFGEIFLHPTLYLLFFKMRFPDKWQKLRPVEIQKIRPEYFDMYFNDKSWNNKEVNIALIPNPHRKIIDRVAFSVAHKNNPKNAKQNLNKGLPEPQEGFETFYINSVKSDFGNFLKQLDLINLASDSFSYKN